MSFEVRVEINEAVKHLQRACFQLLKYEGGLEICERLRKIEKEITNELSIINDDLEVVVKLPKLPKAARAQ